MPIFFLILCNTLIILLNFLVGQPCIIILDSVLFHNIIFIFIESNTMFVLAFLIFFLQLYTSITTDLGLCLAYIFTYIKSYKFWFYWNSTYRIAYIFYSEAASVCQFVLRIMLIWGFLNLFIYLFILFFMYYFGLFQSLWVICGVC